jgi:hypothetical protein
MAYITLRSRTEGGKAAYDFLSNTIVRFAELGDKLSDLDAAPSLVSMDFCLKKKKRDSYRDIR